ncbi:hypothetical protein JCM15764A_20380 [Geotalea toluenoxydans]
MGQNKAVTAREATPVPPPAPTDLRVVIVPEGFHITWKPPVEDPVTVTGYEIARANIFSGPYEVVGKVGKGTFTYTDTSVSPEIIYFYKVRAVAGDTCSPFSKGAAGEISGMPGG